MLSIGFLFDEEGLGYDFQVLFDNCDFCFKGMLFIDNDVFQGFCIEIWYVIERNGEFDINIGMGKGKDGMGIYFDVIKIGVYVRKYLNDGFFLFFI